MRAPAGRRSRRGVGLGVVLALIGLSVACSPDERPELPACRLEVTADARGDLALAVLVANPGTRDEIGRYSDLLDAIELSITGMASADGAPLAVTRGPGSGSPGDDAPRTVTLIPRSGTRLVPALRLRFADGAAKPEGTEQPGQQSASGQAIWTIEHPPAAIRIQLDLAIEGMKPRRCVAEYDPTTR